MRAILVTLGVGFALFGLLTVWLGASDLEADYVNVGTILSRDTPEPRVRTVTVGAVALAFSVLLFLAATRRQRRTSGL